MKRQWYDLTLPGWAIFAAVLALSAVGVASIMSASPPEQPNADSRQMLFIGAACFAAAVMLRLGYQSIGNLVYVLFGISIVLLILLVIARLCGGLPLITRINGTYRWIRLPFFNLQPSEVTKITFILALAWYMRHKENVSRLGGLLGPFALTVVPTFLVLMQPDLGTALLMMPVLFVMVYAAGARLRHLATIVLLALLCLPLFYVKMKPYQKARIAGLLLQYEPIRNSVINDEDSFWRMLCSEESARTWEQGHGYQLLGSKGALGNGGLTGRGWKRGIYAQHNFLPAKHNDFIFAVIGEQWGFVGCLGVLACYLVIIVAGLEIALATSEPFGKLLAVGAVSLISAQCLINVGMTVGMTPITGVTLPFVSYGGSSAIANFLLIALLISVSQNRPYVLARRPFESQEASPHASVG